MRAFCHKIFVVTMLMLLGLTAHARQIDVDDKTLANDGEVYDGIDVSSYQEDIDWSATAKDPNIKFVYVKATEGATYRSRHYEFNIENARKQGIKVGSYHFFRPLTSVQSQFDNFISVVKKEDQDLLPLIDVETKRGVTATQLVDSVQKFADLLEDYYGCRPMIYTGVSFYNSNLRGHFDNYKLFIARYSRFKPKLVGAEWTLWQFSESGRIAGIDHNVDLCRFNTGASLRDILIPGRKTTRRKHAEQQQPSTPPPPRKTEKQQEPKQQEVPLSKKQQKKLEKERKEAEKRAKQQADLRARQQADSARQAREQQRRAEKARKEEQKRLAKQQELVRKQQEKQERKQREAREKLAKQQAEQLKKDQEAQEKARKEQQEKEQAEAAAKKAQTQQSQADAQRKARAEQKAQQQAKAAAKQKKQSANAAAKQAGKRVNQSSADNDE